MDRKKDEITDEDEEEKCYYSMPLKQLPKTHENLKVIRLLEDLSEAFKLRYILLIT